MILSRQVAPSMPESWDSGDNDMAAREQEKEIVQGHALIVAVVFVAALIISLFFYLLLRFYRRQHPSPPKFFPKLLQKRWTNWQPGIYTSAAQSPPQSRITSRPPRTRRAPTRQPIDRINSVRSIMTLPEYRPVASPGIEQTIAREGERGGVDVVVEFPETEEEEERRREDHMQALYEIRLARQLERAAERERNAANSGARANTGNSSNTSRSANPSPVRSSGSLIATLAAAQERERRQSQVSYAEIGVVRHDGSRVRTSVDTTHERDQSRDSLPLLASGAPMGLSSHNRTNSAVSFGSSVGTPERRRSEEIFNPASVRGSMDISVRVVPRSADGDIPGLPAYEGEDWGPPPEYESPVETRNGGPSLLPALRIESAVERATSTRNSTSITRSVSEGVGR